MSTSYALQASENTPRADQAFSLIRELNVSASAQANSVKTLEDAQTKLRAISAKCAAFFGKGPSASAASAPRVATKVNAFDHYKSLTGKARTDYFRANEAAIWAAWRSQSND